MIGGVDVVGICQVGESAALTGSWPDHVKSMTVGVGSCKSSEPVFVGQRRILNGAVTLCE